MRKRVFGEFRWLLFLVVALSVALSSALAERPDKNRPAQGQGLEKTTGAPLLTILNINNFTSFFRADGQGNHDKSDQSGGRFPRNASTALYEDGFVWGGKMYLDAAHTRPASGQLVRVGGQTYNQGTRQGAVTGMGATAVAADPASARARIYRIRRDYKFMSDTEIRSDAATLNLALEADVTSSQMSDITTQYDLDWNNWPVDLGAPYIERNGQAGYQKPPAFSPTFTPADLITGNYDEPGVAGADPNVPADQVIWTVYNDLDPSATQGLYKSDPIGIEGQCTMWGYKRSDALGNLYFKKIKFINKGGVDIGGGVKGAFYIDSMYVSQWSDPDLGDYGDDLCGSDTLLSLGFVYNGNAVDNGYKAFGLPPPAAGYDFLQGPLVPAPGETGIFDLKVRQGYRNLPMTAFVFFSAGAPISDPALSSTYESTLQWYRMLRGYRPDASTQPLRYYPFPAGVTPGPYTLTGDPVTRQGIVDGLGTDYSFVPGDRRIIMATGPFTLAPGDTQEVVMGTVGGIGSDRLSSVSVMKFNDVFVQNTFNALFAVPKPPPAPDVKYAELDGELILEWGSNLTRVNDIEAKTVQPGDYTFEGYNVYQYPRASSTLADAKRIATYDLETDPTVVLDKQFDNASGQILDKAIQFGTNSGVKRYFRFSRDYVNDIDALNNGTAYYLAVTAYSVSRTGYLPSALESNPEVLRLIPQQPKPGMVLGGAFGDTVKTVSQIVAAGGVESDGKALTLIIDPSKLTGHTYHVNFKKDADDNTLWDLKDATTGAMKLTNQTNQSGDANYPFVDGMQVRVSGPNPGMKSWSIPSGTRRFSWAGGFPGLGLEGFGSGTTDAYDQEAGTIGMAGHFAFGGISTNLGESQYRTVLLKLAAVNKTTLWDPKATPTDPNFSRGYRFMRAATSAAAKPEFAPWIINKTSGYPYQDYNYGVPFSAWDMETNPPTRLAVGHLENNVAAGIVDGRYWPPDAGGGYGGDNTASREFAFIWLKPYTETPDPALTVNISSNSSTPLMWVMVCNRRADVDWVAGDQFQITAAHVNSPAVTFVIQAPATTSGNVALAKKDVGNVGVFPNPYYAFNPLEVSRTSRFVTFNRLPEQATVRIFNLAGQLVRTLEKNDQTQFMNWDLANQDNYPVASGMYIVHVDMPTLGTSKILKVAIIQEQEVPNNF